MPRTPTPAARTVPAAGAEPMTPQSRKAARAAFLGFAVDYFDIYLPVVALAPAIGYFQPGNIAPALESTLFYLTFAVTLIGRPIGSMIFGSLSDKIGRRRATLIAVGGFTVATLAMAALPGYAAWGFGGLGCLMFLRLVGGIFMGGEYTSANPLALESCPKPRRGIVGAFIGSAYPVGYIAISLVTLPLLAVLPQTGPDAAYTQWGWRIPFVVGGLLGIVFFWYFHRSIEESPVWTDQAKSGTAQAPLRGLLRDGNGRRLVQMFILMTGLWFAVQAIISPMSGLLITQLKQDPNAVTTALLIANAALFCGYLLFGHLGQRYGRRRVLLLAGIGTAVLSALCFWGAVAILNSGGGFVPAMALYTACLVLAVSPYGIVTVYLLEAFPTRIRASGYGVAYSVSLIIPSFYSLYMLALSTAMPYEYTPVVLIVLSGILTTIGAKLGPETHHVDLASSES